MRNGTYPLMFIGIVYNIDKYLYLDSELKKFWEMKIIVQILVDVFGIVSKYLERRREKLEIRGRTKTIQTIALLRSTRILRRVLEI